MAVVVATGDGGDGGDGVRFELGEVLRGGGMGGGVLDTAGAKADVKGEGGAGVTGLEGEVDLR